MPIPGTKSVAESSRTPPACIPRRWLTLARAAWIVIALLLLASFVVSIPAYYLFIYVNGIRAEINNGNLK